MKKTQRMISSFVSVLLTAATMLCSQSAWAASFIPDYDSFSEPIVMSGEYYTFSANGITWSYRNFKKGSSLSGGSWFNGVVLVEASGDVEGDIVIPSKTPDDRPVIALGEGLFSGKEYIDSVVIPDSITMMFPSVFYGCCYLKEVTIPASVNEISGSIFGKCTRLERVKLGSNIPYISYGMFLDCSSLKEIEWGGKESSIGDQAFLRCSALENIEIPDSVESIGYSFQDCTDLTNVVFGSGLKYLGKTCFTGCGKLRSVKFGDSLISIGQSCFLGCSELRKIEMPDSLEILGGDAFAGCSRITDVKIGDNVKIIGACAFIDCINLTNVVWGANNEVVGESAFLRCKGLKELTIPASVTNLYNGAFDGCSSITNVVIGSGMRTISYDVFRNNTALRKVVFSGDKVRTIGNSCFSGCSALEEFAIPDSVREIGTYLFNDCSNLKTLQIGDSLDVINGGCCSGCSSLSNIIWGASVKTIGYRAFLGCKSLYCLNIPDTVETVGEYAFSNCSGLRFVKIGEECTSILGNAFSGCTHLLTVDADGNVETIGGSAFSGCTNLRYFRMGNSKAPVSVDNYAFPRGTDMCPLFRVFVEEGSTDWTGTDQEGLPESGVWKYWPIDYIANKPENIAAPYDFGFYVPDEYPGYYGGEWPASLYLTTTEEFNTSNPAETIIKEGSTVYLHYAFADRWRCEDVQNLTNKITVSSVGVYNSVWKKIEATHTYAYANQDPIDILQNLAPGNYTLTLELNADGTLAETDYSNNSMEISFTVIEMPKCTVSFNLNGVIGTVPAPRTVIKGKAIGTLPTVTAPKGWTFLGWYTAATGGTKVTPTQVINSNQTFYAHWAKYDLGFILPDDWTRPVYLTAVSSATSSKTTFKVGERIYLKYAFANLAGNYDIKGFVNRFKLNTGAQFDDDWTTFTLPAGNYGWSGDTWYPSALQNLPEGTYTLTCTLDATGLLTETNEGNNTYSFTFSVGTGGGSEPPPAPPPAENKLFEEVFGIVPAAAASEYNGYLYDADGAVAGTILAKVAKPKVDKKTDKVTAKVTATINVTGEKKVSIKGDMDVESGVFAAVDKKSDRELYLEFGEDGMVGTFDIYEIDGARNLFSSKDKEEKADAEEFLEDYLGSLNMAWEGGTLAVTIAKKGKVTIKGAVADGTKVSAKSQLLIGEEWMCIPVLYSKKSTTLAFTLWLPIDGGEAEVVGLEDAVVGYAGELVDGASFYVEGDFSEAIDNVIEEINGFDVLPNGVSVTKDGKKWEVAKGIKAAKVSYKKEVLSIAPGKKDGEIVNASGLKLSYKVKDGSFTGSFTVYAIDEKGKMKKHKASVSGVLIEGVGYGTATIKKIGSWAIVIE